MPRFTHLSELLAAQPKAATALRAPERRPLSYGELSAVVEQTLAALNGWGIGRGDRVAMVLPNGPEMAAAFLAVANAATSAPLNPAYRADEFEFYMTDLRAKALLVEQGSTSPAVAVAKRLGLAVIELCTGGASELGAGAFTLALEAGTGAGIVGAAAARGAAASGAASNGAAASDAASSGAAASGAASSGAAGPDDIALILHTSGTTSRPKIVPLSQRNVCASASNVQSTLELSERDVGLNIMPLFHIHGLIAGLLAPLSVGGCVFCTPGFSALKFFAWMREAHPTWYTAVPTMHQAIVARAGGNRAVIAENPLRFIRSSSSSLPPQVIRELEEVFGAPVLEAYGMTEAAHQMASNRLHGKRIPGSVGVAAGPEVAIMDAAGTLLPPGSTGEIVIRGVNVTLGYENNPAANRDAFTNGWFRTGDQGVMDAEGYVTLTGRLKEIINRGGEKISPREVDEVLMDHPAVAQVVTFAFPHDKLGEEVAAAVVLREGKAADGKELQKFAASRLADFKVPKKILLLEEIPKGATGKLQRIGLAQKLGLA